MKFVRTKTVCCVLLALLAGELLCRHWLNLKSRVSANLTRVCFFAQKRGGRVGGGSRDFRKFEVAKTNMAGASVLQDVSVHTSLVCLLQQDRGAYM